MTIQELGSLGELIAAVATVATLIYLAIQIRSSTVVAEAEARRSTRELVSPVHQSIVENADVARIFREGLGDPSKLDPDEWLRFSFLMGQMLGATSSILEEVHDGVLPNDFTLNQKASIRFLATPGGRKFWEQVGPSYSDAFREFVHKVLSESSANWAIHESRSAAHQAVAADASRPWALELGSLLASSILPSATRSAAGWRS